MIKPIYHGLSPSFMSVSISDIRPLTNLAKLPKPKLGEAFLRIDIKPLLADDFSVRTGKVHVVGHVCLSKRFAIEGCTRVVRAELAQQGRCRG